MISGSVSSEIIGSAGLTEKSDQFLCPTQPPGFGVYIEAHSQVSFIIFYRLYLHVMQRYIFLQ